MVVKVGETEVFVRQILQLLECFFGRGLSVLYPIEDSFENLVSDKRSSSAWSHRR